MGTGFDVREEVREGVRSLRITAEEMAGEIQRVRATVRDGDPFGGRTPDLVWLWLRSGILKGNIDGFAPSGAASDIVLCENERRTQ